MNGLGVASDMAIASAAYLLIYAATASFCVTFTALNYLAWRRTQRLNALLQHLCLKAWLLHKWPLYHAFLDYADLDIEVKKRRRTKP